MISVYRVTVYKVSPKLNFIVTLSIISERVLTKLIFFQATEKDCHSLQKDRLQHRFLRQIACMVVKPIIVDNFASLFNCTTVVKSSDYMTTPSSICFRWSVPDY